MSADKLYFFSRSRNVRPGKGTKEVVSSDIDYINLAKMKNWRRMLSNFHMEPFFYGGKKYGSIEHAFQAEKIAMVDKALAYRFTMDSGDPIGMGDAQMARANRKLVLLKGDILHAWMGKNSEIMAKIARAKYEQSSEARAVLKATGNAELWHVVGRGKPVRFSHLEEIRAAL